MSFPHVDLSGAKAWRLIPTRVPSADLLARVADPADYDLLNALESQTNRRIQAFGHANVYVAAAFAYSLGGTPSRFNDGTWGTIYVGLEAETALEEVRFWQSRYLKGDRAAATRLDFRMLSGTLEGEFLDLRSADLRAEFDRNSYGASQAFARIHQPAERGLAYPSLRAPGGSCVVGFRTDTVRDLKHHHQVVMAWDGKELAL
ncbi:MAG: RES family NAD+ phosphorylase [Holophaga sp.]|nr:RES family NAD+ phosphorylase [Holophaga sp.]